MVVIVDYGMGNVGSIKNILKKIGFESVISCDPKEIQKASKLILPGVGSFDRAMVELELRGITQLIKAKATSGTPLLGICLGMQLLANTSEEGKREGLGLIPGKVIKFHKTNGLKIPHMGWNQVSPRSYDGLFQGLDELEEIRFYFVHSYHFRTEDSSHILGETEYGFRFTSAVMNGNIYGVQFHPEKSHTYGMRLLTNFMNI